MSITTQFERELGIKRMFMRYISHEIRTPLNTVCMGLQLLLRQAEKKCDVSLDDQTTGVVRDLQSSCSDAIEVLNDLLTYDKIEDGALQLDKIRLDVRDFVARTIHAFRLQVGHWFCPHIHYY